MTTQKRVPEWQIQRMYQFEVAQDVARSILNTPMVGGRSLAKFEARNHLSAYCLNLAANSGPYTGTELCELAEHAAHRGAISETVWGYITTFAERY